VNQRWFLINNRRSSDCFSFTDILPILLNYKYNQKGSWPVRWTFELHLLVSNALNRKRRHVTIEHIQNSKSKILWIPSVWTCGEKTVSHLFPNLKKGLQKSHEHIIKTSSSVSMYTISPWIWLKAHHTVHTCTPAM